MSEFSTSFADADNLFVLDIYPASEQPIPGITAEALTEKIAATGRPAMYVSSTADAILAATSVAKPGDIILTLGAGSIYQLGPQIVEALKSKLASTAL
jgi:UDP-N-acetylmuramate--alanine ligase